MTNDRINAIVASIGEIKNTIITKAFTIDSNQIVSGSVVIEMDKDTRLPFDVKIYPQYPLRSHDAETINFINQELIEFDHVMGDGSICIHTYHNPDLRKKIHIDFASLNKWIDKYYLLKGTDTNYEHIIVPKKLFHGAQRVFLFTEADYEFRKGEYGEVEYSYLSTGLFHKDPVYTYVVQKFKSAKNSYDCKWNSSIKNLTKEGSKVGLFFFAEQPPVFKKKFVVLNWLQLKSFLNQGFLNKLHNVQKEYSKDQKGTHMPLFIGYKIGEKEIHWQAIMLEVGDFPIHGIKVEKNYYTEVVSKDIEWGLTRNCSPSYFFGRGKLSDRITKKKILIIGIGAVGSIVATTLTRGGSFQIDLIDYDIKEPENICRSEYRFISGLNNKANDLASVLTEISPFVEVRLNYEFSEVFNFYLKAFYQNTENRKSFEDCLNNYDLIFDCSTDNDLMYVLNQLEIKADVINFSISNHANELVCGVKPNYYHFVMEQFENRVKNDLEDLYNPTGCWNPTFKASYNDINVLIQFAIKHINTLYEKKLSLRNFVIKALYENGFNIKLEQY
jgi:molybdopterin/thiamine biosynthesis adenylyltransferase